MSSSHIPLSDHSRYSFQNGPESSYQEHGRQLSNTDHPLHMHDVPQLSRPGHGRHWSEQNLSVSGHNTPDSLLPGPYSRQSRVMAPSVSGRNTPESSYHGHYDFSRSPPMSGRGTPEQDHYEHHSLSRTTDILNSTHFPDPYSEQAVPLSGRNTPESSYHGTHESHLSEQPLLGKGHDRNPSDEQQAGREPNPTSERFSHDTSPTREKSFNYTQPPPHLQMNPQTVIFSQQETKKKRRCNYDCNCSSTDCLYCSDLCNLVVFWLELCAVCGHGCAECCSDTCEGCADCDCGDCGGCDCNC